MVIFNFDLLDEGNFSTLYRFASIRHDNTVNQILLDLRSALIRGLNFKLSDESFFRHISIDLKYVSHETIAEAIDAISRARVHFASAGEARAATFCSELMRAIKEDSQKMKESVTAKIQDSGNRTRNKKKPQKKAKPFVSQVETQGVTANENGTAKETVPSNFFDRMAIALTQVVGPMAPIIIYDHVAALGESMEKFPKVRVSELIEIVSAEISIESLKVEFREILNDNL